MPLTSRNRFTISYDPTITTLRIFVGPTSSSTSSSGETDTKGDIMIREVKSFGLTSAGLTDLIPGEVGEDVRPEDKLKGLEVMIGLMACSPIGKGDGPECVFKNIQMREGAREIS